MAIIVFLQSFARGKDQGRIAALWTGVNWHRPLIITLAILGFILVLENLGFILTSFLLMFVLFKWVEKISWAKAIFIPGLVLGLTYLVFEVFLKATLPKGFLGF
jgi:putative tricarboxylic transport membrane protein